MPTDPVLSLYVVILATLGLHRLWTHEQIFQPLRSYAKKLPKYLNKPFTCPPCSAFWVAALVSYSVYFGPAYWQPLFWALAAYFPARLMLMVYPLLQAKGMRSHPVMSKPKPKPQGGCKSCGQKRPKPPVQKPDQEPPKPKPVAPSQEGQHFYILTTFASMHEAYSLVQVVRDQIRAGLYNGWFVHLVTLDKFKATEVQEFDGNERFSLHAVLPTWVWKEDTVDGVQRRLVEKALAPLLLTHENPLIISHDICFQEHFLTYAAALHSLGGIPGAKFYHQAHSAARIPPQEGDAARYRASLPEGHRALSLCAVEQPHLAHYYQAPVESVVTLPNARDLTYLLGMDDLTRELIYAARLLTVDVAMVYPLNMDRAEAKGVSDLVRLMAAFKRKGIAASLLIVDSHASDERSVAATQSLRSVIHAEGLQGDVVFASDNPKVPAYSGLTNRQVMDLFQASNLFVFPSRSECSPLVLLEAAASGCLVVINREVLSMREVVTEQEALLYPFGDEGRWRTASHFDRLAAIIQERLDTPANQSQRKVLRERCLPVYAERLQSLAAS